LDPNNKGEPPVIDDVALQHLWMSLQKRRWRTAAIVSVTPHVSTLEVANTIAQLCWTCRAEATVALDLRATGLKLLDHHKKHVEEQVKKGSCVVLALPSLEESPVAVSLARACDTAIMVVRLNETPMEAAKRAIEEIGRERFAGAVLATSAAAVVPLFHKEPIRATVRMPAVTK
jgi:hypothetical protein